ncbi:hypothetical protein ACIGXG_16355 [Streptomyces goshikiensis]|uniref:hypothetical protein n=1 Tax=Streptomyces goshikiensis TaxID=1942 RepID=UPI0037D5A1FA
MQRTSQNLIDTDAALNLAGPDAEVFPVPGAIVVVGPSSTVIIAHPGDDPEVSGVWNAQEFRLVGPAPAPVVSRLMGPMPFTTPGTPPQPLVHLFVRLDDGCVHLGVVRVSMCEAGEDVLIRCRLRISPPLSRESLDCARPPTTLPLRPALDWLGDVHTNPGRALERFVTGWYPVTSTQELAADIPRSIPWALADFYRLAAHRPAMLGSHNRIKPINKVHPDSSAEHLVFGVECQGGWTWSIPWEPGGSDTDPTVWFEDSHPVPEEEPLSRFLLQFALEEATLSAVYQASCNNLPRHLLPALESYLQRVPLRPFLSPADAPTDFLVAPGLVARVGPSWDDGKVDVWIGAQHRSFLQPLNRLDIPWRHFDG